MPDHVFDWYPSCLPTGNIILDRLKKNQKHSCFADNTAVSAMDHSCFLSKSPSFPSWSEPAPIILASCLMMFLNGSRPVYRLAPSFCNYWEIHSKGCSCAGLLLATIDDWLITKDHKMSTSIVFIDLSKAFDNVRHDKLLIKLQKLGVSGTVLKWIHNFLRNRMQKVCGWKS